MPAPRRIAAFAVICALAAAPAGALAQNGAGDEQYSDPFAGGSQQPAKPKPKPAQTQQQTAPQTAPQPAQSTQAAPQPAPSAPQPSTPASAQLPRTGFDVIPLAIAGAVLLLAGVLLLRRGAAHDR